MGPRAGALPPAAEDSSGIYGPPAHVQPDCSIHGGGFQGGGSCASRHGKRWSFEQNVPERRQLMMIQGDADEVRKALIDIAGAGEED